jgi:hypothetical protein
MPIKFQHNCNKLQQDVDAAARWESDWLMAFEPAIFFSAHTISQFVFSSVISELTKSFLMAMSTPPWLLVLYVWWSVMSIDIA